MVVGSWGVAAAGAVGYEYSCSLLPKEKMAPQRGSSTHAKKKKKEWMGGKDGGSRDEEEQSEQQGAMPPPPHTPTPSPEEGILEM